MTGLVKASKERCDKLYRKLLVADVNSQVGHNSGFAGQFSHGEIAFLLSIASRLALSKDSAEQAVAYNIATKLTELYGSSMPTVVETTNVLLARLGNFPGCTVTKKRFGEPKLVSPFSLHALEAMARREENTITIREDEIVLTDFQHRLYDVRSKWPSVSVSAPTSAGKSFLIAIDVIRFLMKANGKDVVILVPTRALIRQVMCDVIVQLNHFGLKNVDVTCIPEMVQDPTKQATRVYVFTQERLTTLLNENDRKDHIGLLIVDEAQELGDESRGIVLQAAIERTLYRNPQTDVLFASPLRANPGFLLSLFGRQEQGSFFTEHNSPVSQNVILVSAVKGKTSQAALELLLDDGIATVGIVNTKHKLRGNDDEVQANAALCFTREGEASILYANGPRAAEKLAMELASKLPESAEIKPEIQEVIDFVREHVHDLYPLIGTLKHGVAFHYGDMPDVVRMGVEDLFQQGHVLFICCTSTLLQGVNLPAKNVFMFKPTRIPDTPIDRGSFWNLAGRAGRMRHEYGGNVWCLLPEDWKEKPYEGTRLVDLESALITALEHQAATVLNVAQLGTTPSEADATKTADQAFGKVFADVSAGRSHGQMEQLSDAARASLDQLATLCADLAKKAQLPKPIFERNSGVSPHRLEELAEYFKGRTDLRNLIPLHPGQKGSYDQLVRIFEVCETVFFKEENERYVYFATLAFYWMQGRTLKEQITRKIAREKIPNDPLKIAKAIRQLLKEITTDIRFRYVKYLRAYYDVMGFALIRAGLPNVVKSMSPLHLYIEYGACHDTLIHLMALGVSRATAQLFAKGTGMAMKLTRQEVEQVFFTVDLSRLDLPALCAHEISGLRRKEEVKA